MKFKKYLAVVLGAGLLLSACGDDGESEDGVDTEERDMDADDTDGQ